MLNLSKKRVLVLLMVVMFLVVVSTNVFAADTNANANTDREVVDSTSNLPTINQTGNVAANNNTSVFAPTNSTANTNNNTNNTTSSLPKTGIDYSLLIVIGLFVVSAVYAYIKIRKYRV